MRTPKIQAWAIAVTVDLVTDVFSVYLLGMPFKGYVRALPARL